MLSYACSKMAYGDDDRIFEGADRDSAAPTREASADLGRSPPDYRVGGRTRPVADQALSRSSPSVRMASAPGVGERNGCVEGAP